MRISAALLVLALLSIAVATWALWPSDAIVPPAGSHTTTERKAEATVGELASVERREAGATATVENGENAPATMPTAENNPDHRPVIAVRGLVRDAVSQVGLGDANVAHLRSDASTTSKTDGSFLLRLPIDEDGAVMLVTCLGYADRHVKLLPSDCCDGQAEVVIELQPGQLFGEITGRVLNAEQQPLPECPVLLLAPLRDSPLVGKQTKTDDEGRFRLTDVAPGTQRLAIRAERHDDFVLAGIELQPRMSHDVGTIRLRQYLWASIRGRVVDDNQQPIADVSVLARTAKNDHAAARTTTGVDGQFALPRVAPGSVTLFFECRGQWAGLRSLTLQPHQQSTQQVRVPVGTNFIGGKVLVGDAPAHGYSADCELSENDLEAYDLDSFHRSVAVGKDGRFRIDGLIGQRVQLTFTRARPWISLGDGEPVATNRLDHVFVFSVLTSTSRVHGFVRDTLGNPIAGAVVRPRDLHDADARAVTGPDGFYELRMPTSAYASTSVHATHANYLRAVSNLPTWSKAEAEIDFVLHAVEDAAKLTILARDQTTPIARARVIVRTEGRQFVMSGTTDGRGQQSFTLGAGKWQVHVRHPNFVTKDLTVELTANQRRTLPVAMESQPRYARTVEVRTDPDQPLAGITVTAWQKGAWVAAGKTNALGQATLADLPYGTIVFTVQPAGHARHALPQDVRWEEQKPVVFRIQRGLQSISGTVYGKENQPVPACEVVCEAQPATGGHVRVYATADALGRFKIDNLVDGTYELQAYVGEHVIKQTTSPGTTSIIMRVE